MMMWHCLLRKTYRDLPSFSSEAIHNTAPPAPSFKIAHTTCACTASIRGLPPTVGSDSGVRDCAAALTLIGRCGPRRKCLHAVTSPFVRGARAALLSAAAASDGANRAGIISIFRTENGFRRTLQSSEVVSESHVNASQGSCHNQQINTCRWLYLESFFTHHNIRSSRCYSQAKQRPHRSTDENTCNSESGNT